MKTRINRRGETDVWKVIAGIALVLFILFICLMVLSKDFRGMVTSIIRSKPSDATAGASTCNNACETAKLTTTDCTKTQGWKDQYCNVQYNSSLTCYGAEGQNLIAICSHETQGATCDCAA